MPPKSFKDFLLILSVCGVTILNIFVNGALTVATPTIGKELGFKEADLQWPLNVYALSYGCLLLFLARVADVVGSKRMFLAGTAWFAAWSIATALAPSEKTLIVFVALKGIGAAANTPTGISIFAAHFEAGPAKNKAIAALGAGQAVGYILALVLAGFLCGSTATWRAIFYIQAGLAVSFFLLGLWTIPPDEEKRRYTKGLDWGGAILSTIGMALLTYDLSESTTARHGWRTPVVPSLLVVSLVILASFLLYEWYRESRDLSVIMPLSMWTKPGARMRPVVALVFLAWASYNCLLYFVTLYYQQVNLANPVITSVRLLPSAVSAFTVNIVTGYLLPIVPGEWLISVGLLGTIIAPLVYVLQDIHGSYWSGAFVVMIFVSCSDVAYTVANLQISASFEDDSQALAGGIFNVATRLGTSFGLAVGSSIATAISAQFNSMHTELSSTDPLVLMAGFRGAGWWCLGLAIVSWIIGAVGLQKIGIIGGRTPVSKGEVDDEGAEKPSRRSMIGNVDVSAGLAPHIPPTLTVDRVNLDVAK